MCLRKIATRFVRFWGTNATQNDRRITNQNTVTITERHQQPDHDAEMYDMTKLHFQYFVDEEKRESRKNVFVKPVNCVTFV